MKIISTDIPAVKILEPTVFKDKRGYFFESFREDILEKLDFKGQFIQDNQSLSGKNILRGLHFQAPPFAQAKLVRVVKGAVLDIAVDIRKSSKTYGKYVSVLLSEDNFKQVFIPEGFAHGFITLEENTIFQYKCSNYYNKASEGGLMWNDTDLAIDWQAHEPIISEKDEQNPLFKDFESPFA